MKKIIVFDYFIDADLKQKIADTAAEKGYSVDFYRDDPVPDEKLAEYEIMYGLPYTRYLKKMTALKWVCSSFAGVDTLTDKTKYANPDVIVSNSSGAYGITISEHLIMVTLMLLRRIPEYTALNEKRQWLKPNEKLQIRSILDSTITIVGTGDIGTNYAKRCKALGAARIIGVRRSDRPGDPVYDEMYSFTRLPELLPSTHILALCLPGTAETTNLLSKEMISLLPEDAVVINVGRGNSIDQNALIDALNSGRIAGAAMDVFEQEPIPEDDPVWTAKNLVLTPHCSGNMSLRKTRELTVKMFLEDFENYTEGRPLQHQVNLKRGY